MRQSYGNTILVEPYELGQGIKQEVRGAFAFTVQKKALVGLKVMVDATLLNGAVIKKGQIAYFKEDKLSTEGWVKDVREIGTSGDKVILADLASVIFFETIEGASLD